MVQLRMLVDISIELPYLFLDFAHQGVILAFLCFFISSQIFIKLIQQRKQIFTELIEFFLHFNSHENILPGQVDYCSILDFRLVILEILRLHFTLVTAFNFFFCEIGELQFMIILRLCNNICYDFILFIEFSRLGFQHVRPCIIIMCFLYDIIQISYFYECNYLHSAAVDDTIDKFGFRWIFCHRDLSLGYKLALQIFKTTNII